LRTQGLQLGNNLLAVAKRSCYRTLNKRHSCIKVPVVRSLVYMDQVRLMANNSTGRDHIINHNHIIWSIFKWDLIDDPVFQVFILGHFRVFYFILVENQSFLPQVFYCRIIIINFLTGIRFSKAKPREKLIANVRYVFVPYRLRFEGPCTHGSSGRRLSTFSPFWNFEPLVLALFVMAFVLGKQGHGTWKSRTTRTSTSLGGLRAPSLRTLIAPLVFNSCALTCPGV